MKPLDVISAILLIIGGLNWGIVGIFDFNVVDYIFGSMKIDRIVYVLVGAAAVYFFFAHQKAFGCCLSKKKKR